MIPNVFIHLINDLPIVADLEALPSGGDLVISCTNLRTVDGKRPPFVHDPAATFVFPLAMVRLIEAPAEGAAEKALALRAASETALEVLPMVDEEPDEDLLARIREA